MLHGVQPGAQLALGGTPAGIGPGALGASSQAAAFDHVHPFGAALKRGRIAAVTQSVQWVYTDNSGNPSPFANGVIPIIGCLIECPTTTMVFGEPQITSIDNTQVTLMLRTQSISLNILALGTVNLFQGGNPPANTFLHLHARDPNA